MKYLVVALAFLISVVAKAQTNTADLRTNTETGLAEWTSVEDMPGLSKDELYDRAMAWINTFYSNPAGMLKVQDKTKGEIEGKTRIRLNNKDKKGVVTPGGGFVDYTIKLYFKEGKYKYEITRVHWVQSSYYDVSRWLDKNQANYNEVNYNYYLQQVTDYMDDLENSLVTGMKKSTAKPKSDW